MPAPASKTGVETGLVAAPTIQLRTGAEFTIAARASHRAADSVSTAPSGYVEATAGPRGPPASKGSIGVK